MKHRLLRSQSGFARVLLYLMLLIACWELYHFISLVAPRHTAIAHEHAAALLAFEHRLGLMIEPQFQHFALYHARPSVLGWLFDNSAIRYQAKLIYAGGQIPWLASMLIWAALFRPRYVKRLCILAIVGSLIGIMVAALYPVAPPRFALAGPPYFMEDVNRANAPEQELVLHGGFDPYAAMPSLHVLWGLITGLGLFLGTRRWTFRVLATIYPISIVATVIVTGNHYVLDCVASVLLFTVCLGCYWMYRRVCRAGQAAIDPRSTPGIEQDNGGRERRVAPNLRPLDFPMLLCVIAGVPMILSGDIVQCLFGLFLVVVGGLAAPAAVLRITAGHSLRDTAPTAEWFSGFLLVAGATTLGASDLVSRSAGSLCWVAAALLPLLARMDVQTWFAEFSRRRATRYPFGRAKPDRIPFQATANRPFLRASAPIRAYLERVRQAVRSR